MNEKLREFLSTSLFLLTVVVVSFLLLKFVCQRTEVIGSSMMTTLYDGDNLILNKISYQFSDPERFDIIVFPFRDNTDRNYIKRVIGLPNETIRIDTDGTIYINDNILYESYGREIIRDPGNASVPITLGEDEYFVMGDNRNNSDDSRFNTVGIVKRDEIIGKAWVRIWPFKEFGKVE